MGIGGFGRGYGNNTVTRKPSFGSNKLIDLLSKSRFFGLPPLDDIISPRKYKHKQVLIDFFLKQEAKIRLDRVILARVDLSNIEWQLKIV